MRQKPSCPDSLTLGCPETFRRMSISLAVASRSSCTSWGEMFPAVMSMIFTAYSCLVALWMHRRTTLLTPLPGAAQEQWNNSHPRLHDMLWTEWMESLSHSWEMEPMILMGPSQHRLFYKLIGYGVSPWEGS